MVTRALTSEDLDEVVMLVDEQAFVKDMMKKGSKKAESERAVKDKVSQCSKKLMRSPSITQLITQTVKQVARKQNATEEHIKSHIADAAKQFIIRVIDDVFAELEKLEYNASNNSNQNNNNDDKTNATSKNESVTDTESLEIQETQGDQRKSELAGKAGKISPMFGKRSLQISPNMIDDALAVISIKRDEDLLADASVSKRNSFRNVQRPDLSQVPRYQGSTEDQVKRIVASYVESIRGNQRAEASAGGSTKTDQSATEDETSASESVSDGDTTEPRSHRSTSDATLSASEEDDSHETPRQGARNKDTDDEDEAAASSDSDAASHRQTKPRQL